MKFITKYRNALIIAMFASAWALVFSTWYLPPTTVELVRYLCYPLIVLGVVALATFWAK